MFHVVPQPKRLVGPHLLCRNFFCPLVHSTISYLFFRGEAIGPPVLLPSFDIKLYFLWFCQFLLGPCVDRVSI